MGLFVDKVVNDADLAQAITETLQADPRAASIPAEVNKHVAAAKKAAATKPTFKWSRILVGLAIGGGVASDRDRCRGLRRQMGS
jgi:hypothetical protein